MAVKCFPAIKWIFIHSLAFLKIIKAAFAVIWRVHKMSSAIACYFRACRVQATQSTKCWQSWRTSCISQYLTYITADIRSTPEMCSQTWPECSADDISKVFLCNVATKKYRLLSKLEVRKKLWISQTSENLLFDSRSDGFTIQSLA